MATTGRIIRKADVWPDEKDVSSVVEDSGTERAQRIRSRLEAWDPAGLQWVRVKAAADGTLQTSGSGGSGGTAQADKSAFTEGTTSFTPVGGVYNETITSDPSEDQAAAARITAKRALHANLRTAAGVELPGDATNGLDVDVTRVQGTVTVDSELTTADLDTGAGTDTRAVVGLVRAESGGGVLVGSANPLPVTQSSQPLPTGAATEATLANIDGDLGASTDAEATGNGSVIALLKRLRTLLAGGLPAALTAGGNLKCALLEAIPAGTNNIGDVDVLTLPSLPAGTNNIGDVDVLTLPSLPAGTNNIGDVDVASMPTGQGKTLLFASIDTATSGDNTLVAADASNKIKLVSYVLVASGAVSVRWKAGTTNKSGAMALAANGGISAVGQPSAHLLETAVNEALILNLSAAVQVSGHISYFKEA